MNKISGITYGDISNSIERLKHQTAIISQIFCSKKYVGLIKGFQEEGIVLISDSNKDDRIIASLIE